MSKLNVINKFKRKINRLKNGNFYFIFKGERIYFSSFINTSEYTNATHYYIFNCQDYLCLNLDCYMLDIETDDNIKYITVYQYI